MCYMKSMILLKDKVFCPDYDSHADMLKELNLKDYKSFCFLKPDFVKIEITPPCGDMTKPVENWIFRLDQDMVPAWYVPAYDEPRCRAALVEWHKSHVFFEGDHDVIRGHVYLLNKATATLHNNSEATLQDKAVATLWHNATATLMDESRAILRNNSKATLKDESVATLWDESTATLRDESMATLQDDSTATLRNKSTAILWDNAKATPHDRAVSIKRASDSAKPIITLAEGDKK